MLFITAQSDPTDRLRGFEAWGADYITKPLYAEEVLAPVRLQLQIRSLQRALAQKNTLLENAMTRAAGGRGATPTITRPRGARGGRQRGN